MKKKPQRMCVSCKRKAEKKELMRVVLLSDGGITYDPSGRLPGRGSYLCKNEDCIMQELKAHRLSKGLRHTISDDELRSVAERILDLCENDSTSVDSISDNSL